jgi:protein-tyrosine-phosphatase
MGEGWLRHDLGDRIEVRSAGTRPSFVHPLAIRVMREAGVDISSHRSKSVEELKGLALDLVVTVCDSAREACPILPGARKTFIRPSRIRPLPVRARKACLSSGACGTRSAPGSFPSSRRS